MVGAEGAAGFSGSVTGESGVTGAASLGSTDFGGLGLGIAWMTAPATPGTTAAAGATAPESGALVAAA
jgi:hypothetical protein